MNTACDDTRVNGPADRGRSVSPPGRGGAATRRGVLLLLGLILVSAMSIRAYRLTARSVWFDEATSWRVSGLPLRELLASTARDSHVPAYFLILKVWTAIAGDSLWAMRGLSVLFAGVTIAGVYLFAVEAFRWQARAAHPIPAVGERWVGLFAAALVAVSLLQVKCAWEMRMYTLGTALVALSSWTLFRALSAPRGAWKWWTCHTLLTILFVYTHHYALFSVAAQILFLVALSIRRSGRFATRDPVARGAALSYLVVAAAWAPWAPVLVRQVRQVQDHFWTAPSDGWGIMSICYEMFLDGPAPAGGAVVAAVACAAVLVGLGLAGGPARWYVIAMAALPFAAAVTASTVGRNILVVRYLLFAHVFLLIGVAALVGTVRDRWVRAGLAALLLGNGVAAYVDSWLSLDITNKPGMRAAADYVASYRKSGEEVVVSTPLLYFPASYHLRNRAACRMYTDGTPLPHNEGGPFTFDTDLIRADALGGLPPGRVWVICRRPSGSEVAIPPSWQCERTEVFREAYEWQGKIYVLTFRVPSTSVTDREG